ncbi:hypothetical protein D9M69_723640 [compost metagenome]
MFNGVQLDLGQIPRCEFEAPSHHVIVVLAGRYPPVTDLGKGQVNVGALIEQPDSVIAISTRIPCQVGSDIPYDVIQQKAVKR